MAVFPWRAPRAAFVLPALLAFPAAADPSPAPPASTVRVNDFVTGDQDRGSLAALSDGTLLVAWDSRRQRAGRSGVYARRLSGAGEPLGPEVALGADEHSIDSEPAVAAAGGSAGGAWFAWTSVGRDGDAGAIVARRFDLRLEHAGPEIAVNVSSSGHQSSPVIAADARGRALVVWVSEQPGGRSALRARLLSAAGHPLTGEIDVASASPSFSDTCPAVAAGPDGFVVAWARADGVARPLGVFARLLDTAARPRSLPRSVSESGGTAAIEPALAVDPRGRVLIAWMSGQVDGAHGVRARWHDEHLEPLAPPFMVAGAGALSGASVAFTGEAAAIAWNRPDLGALRARLFTPDGTPIGAEFAPAPAPGPARLAPASGATRLVLAGGRLVAAWSGDAGLGDRSGVHATVTRLRPGDDASPIRVAAGGDRGALAPRPEPVAPPTWEPRWRPQPPAPPGVADGPDFGFEAITATGWNPPDPDLAVGANHLVAIVNGQIAFFDKQGNNSFRQPLGGSTGTWFFQSAGAASFVFDGEVRYDPFHGRFWAMACERFGAQSYFLVAVSDDGDPNGVWHKYRINVSAAGGPDIDSPNLALDAQAVYLSADFPSMNDRHLVYMLPKAALLAGGALPAATSLQISNAPGLALPQSWDAGPPAQYLVQAAEAGGSSVSIHAVRSPLTVPTRVVHAVPVPAFEPPVPPTQMGTSVTLQVFGPRFWTAIHRAGSLWTAHHVRSSDGRTVVRWYEFALAGWPEGLQTPVLRQWGQIDPGPGLHAYFPSISVDADGGAAVTFARSGATELIGMWRAVRRAADPLGTLRDPVLVKSSTTPFTNGGRWGDYSSTQPDPGEGCTHWGHHEWTTSTGMWRTWIARYRVTARADVNDDCLLNLADFGAFQTLFALGDPRADFNDDGQLNLADFGSFQTHFALGR